jgi:hypothetical protein
VGIVVALIVMVALMTLVKMGTRRLFRRPPRDDEDST